MYIQKTFQEHRTAVLHELIIENPLATFVTTQGQEIAINHMPFVLDSDAGEYGTLLGHMPRSNSIWEAFDGKTKAVAVFLGPAAYISPNWYASKIDHGKVVPTWNYVVAHGHGCPRAIHDPDWLFHHLNQLTSSQEANQPRPWKVSDAPNEYTEKMVKSIVGIEIPITMLIGKWKVSQNKSEADRIGVADGLARQGDEGSLEMAELVMRHAD